MNLHRRVKQAEVARVWAEIERIGRLYSLGKIEGYQRDFARYVFPLTRTGQGGEDITEEGTVQWGR